MLRQPLIENVVCELIESHWDQTPLNADCAIFQKVFREIYGKPCWNVKPGYGSFFSREFGKPHLEVRHQPSRAKALLERYKKPWLAGTFLFMASGT